MYVYLLAVPLLLVLELAAALERRAHEALFVLHHGCRPDDYRWFPGVRGPAEPGPFPSETAADAAMQPRHPRRWLGWGLAALALAGCLLLVSPREIAAALRHLSLAELAALLLATLDRLLMGLRWGVLLRLAGVRLPRARAVRLFYQASAVGTLLPSHLGGDLLRGWWAVREGRARPPGRGLAGHGAPARAGVGRQLGGARRRPARRSATPGRSRAPASAGWPTGSTTAKAQQMRWSRATVPPFLDVRAAVLNDTLEDAFRRRHPGFRPANDDHELTGAAA